MGEQLSILRLVAQASVTVQVVIGILLLASLMSWSIIFTKSRIIARARREADRFETRFWSGDDLAQLYRTIESAGGATANSRACARVAPLPSSCWRVRAAPCAWRS
jgi:biopolymer transport protein TolQ